MIWQYESKGIYTSSSLYAIIKFRGVKPVYIPSIWSLVVPPRVQVFLWLLAHNKLMTKNNLLKRGIEKPPECVFCLEQEMLDHFFDCVVARKIWETVAIYFGGLQMIIILLSISFVLASFGALGKREVTTSLVTSLFLRENFQSIHQLSK